MIKFFEAVIWVSILSVIFIILDQQYIASIGG